MNLQYSIREEIFNAISHGVGALLAIIGTIIMIVCAVKFNTVASVVAVSIYGGTMIFMYLMSTLYHAITHDKAKRILQIFDHTSIFLLIAGCYTPIFLVLLDGKPKEIGLLVVVWIAAIVGIILNIIDMKRFKKLSMILYLAMGWSAIIDIKNIVAALGTAGTNLIVAGGLAYTVGVIFYKMKSVKYMHGIWHLFVLAGSAFHYVGFLLYIVLV